MGSECAKLSLELDGITRPVVEEEDEEEEDATPVDAGPLAVPAFTPPCVTPSPAHTG